MPAADAPPSTLTRDAILDAAVALADRESLGALSMRRVARELGRAPMSLYRHVADAESLLAAVVERLVARVEVVDHGEDWRRTLTEAATGVRGMIGRHPGILEAIMRSGIQSESMLVTADVVFGALLQAGLTPEQAVPTYRALFATIFGDAVMRRAAEDVLGGGAAAEQEYLDRFVAVDHSRFPNLEAVTPHLHVEDPDAAFSFVVARLLDGIAALADG